VEACARSGLMSFEAQMSEEIWDRPWTRSSIRRAPIESQKLLRDCEQYSIRLGEPRIVGTSCGPRVMRPIIPTEAFWRNWSRYYWTFKRLGVIVDRDDGTARLWTRL